jgi:hypothetical protein
MGKTQDFIIQQLSSTGDINNFSKDTNTLLYIPEPTDSIITGNQSTKTSIRINGKEIINTIE